MTTKNNLPFSDKSLISFLIISFFLMFGYIGLNHDKLFGKKVQPTQTKSNQNIKIEKSLSVEKKSTELENKPASVKTDTTIQQSGTAPVLTPEQKAYKDMEKQHTHINDVFMQLNESLTKQLAKQKPPVP